MPAMLRRATLFAGCAVSFAAAAGRSLAQTVTTAPRSPIGGGPTYPFSVPPLPYAVSANEPYIDAQTMELHHDKHHAAYVANLNAVVKDHSRLRPCHYQPCWQSSTNSRRRSARPYATMAAAMQTTRCFGRLWRQGR
ncbi:MAG: hypothetical protein ACLPKW_30805 [Acetobacteraceae bacterium]